MNETQAPKQQIVERVKQSSNILVTVNRDPTVDELSAALGLTIMLNNMGKHATAVVSGTMPAAIAFLDPEKTFENTVDSLRDFIIALNKEKADHLRYKVDGDVVKIFITPYRTTISQEDLEFSQGDYNVEFVLALGVKSQDNLDQALEAHGRILHDATVATISAGNESSSLGSIGWNEPGASSISEMLVSLSEALKNGDKPVLDEQIATALLTGIVAATDRFSNDKTSSKVMTMAAQLMAAGANQQLIAAKLEEAHEIGPDSPSSSDSKGNADGTTDIPEGQSTKVAKQSDGASATKEEAPKPDGSLSISHEMEGDVDEVAKQTAADAQASAAEKAEQALANQLQAVAPAAASPSPSPSVADLHKDLAAAGADVDKAASQTQGTDEPSMGGTLNATTEQAAEDKRREVEEDRNKTILTHGTPIGSGAPIISQPPINGSIAGDKNENLPGLPLEFAQTPPASSPTPTPTPAPVVDEQPQIVETLADLDKKTRDLHADALADVHAAFDTTPSQPTTSPVAPTDAPTPYIEQTPPANSNNTNLPPLPNFTVPLPPPPPVFGQPQPVGPSADSQPASSTVAPFAPNPSATLPSAPDPNQFQIPGQN